MLQLGPPGSSVFLKLSRFYDNAVHDSEYPSFVDRIARCCCIVDALVKPCIEALERFVRILCLLDFGVVYRKVCGGYPRIVAVEVTDELEHQDF